MKMHLELGMTQKFVWFLTHGRCKILETDNDESDETYIGGKRKKLAGQIMGRCPTSKTVVLGIMDRETNEVSVNSVPYTTNPILQEIIKRNANKEAKDFTDKATSYTGLPFYHAIVNHSAKKYVREQAHINGMVSFWASHNCRNYGTFHQFRTKHLDRYMIEFPGRHNLWENDMVDMIDELAVGMNGKRLRYDDLIA